MPNRADEMNVTVAQMNQYVFYSTAGDESVLVHFGELETIERGESFRTLAVVDDRTHDTVRRLARSQFLRRREREMSVHVIRSCLSFPNRINRRAIRRDSPSQPQKYHNTL